MLCSGLHHKLLCLWVRLLSSVLTLGQEVQCIQLVATRLRFLQDHHLLSQCVSQLAVYPFKRLSKSMVGSLIVCLLLCVFGGILRLNLLVFIMKLVLYLYARFLLSVLYTVLVIPRDLQIPPREQQQ